MARNIVKEVENITSLRCDMVLKKVLPAVRPGTKILLTGLMLYESVPLRTETVKYPKTRQTGF